MSVVAEERKQNDVQQKLKMSKENSALDCPKHFFMDLNHWEFDKQIL